MTWHLMSESSPPLGCEYVLLEPQEGDEPPLIWQVTHTSEGFMFHLPWEQVCRKYGYSDKENLKFMRETLDRCTHWAHISDVITLPEIKP